MLTAARDRVGAAEDGEFVESPPLPFRLAIAPAIDGEVVDDGDDTVGPNPVIKQATEEPLTSTDIAGASNTVDLEDRRARPCRLSSFSDDELALEIERRLAEREAAEAVNG
jgi:hypothetical protein